MAALLALASSLMWGSSDFLGGVMSRRHAAFAVYGVSQLIALLALVVVVAVTGSWQAPLGYLPWAVASALLGLAGMLAFYQALSIGPMGIVSPLAGLSVLVPLAYALLTGEAPSPVQILGIVLAVVGILLASGPELSGAESARPVVLALIAMAFFGGMYITMAKGSAYNALMTTTGMRMTTAVIVLVVAAWARSAGGFALRDLGPLAALGLLDAGANVTYGLATTMGLLSVTAVLGSLYPVVTAVLAAVFLRERLRAVQYAGVAVAIVAIVAIGTG